MPMFRSDNTDGFTAAELAVMNDEYNRDLAEALSDLPNGAEGASDDLIAEIKQSLREAVLRRHGAA